ncbi:hypothetical protein [Metabacillus halosaccharovorans]|uniref:hypothetical protein n=1 Tax=Metabacillus halosaccharovorans TaxID=930124 RepID=UPI001C1F2A54|nr:hypothetical protein [Metabacillus halosaccharovorans]
MRSKLEMSFIRGMKNKTGEKQTEMPFIRGMKDKTGEKQTRNAFHKRYEGQNR